MQLANTINVLNEKGIKYKVEQKEGNLSMAFGLIAEGKKNKIELIPSEADIQIKGIGAVKQVNEAGLSGFLDNVVALKAIQEKEIELVEALKA